MGDNKKVNQFSKISNLQGTDLLLGWDKSAGTTNYVTVNQISQFASGDIDTDNWFEFIYVTKTGYIQNIETTGLANIGEIRGGDFNTQVIDADNSSILAGKNNHISGDSSAIGGGEQSRVEQNCFRSFIGGGFSNEIKDNADNSTIGGGTDNIVTTDGSNAFLGAGNLNTLESFYGFIGAGQNNISSGDWSSILGGKGNEIAESAEYSFIGAGESGTVLGSHAGISYGESNRADFNYSWAGGKRALSQSFGAAVWKDGTDQDITDSGLNTLVCYFSGGIYLEGGGLFVNGGEVTSDGGGGGSNVSLDLVYGSNSSDNTQEIHTDNQWFTISGLEIRLPADKDLIVTALFSYFPPSTSVELTGRFLTGTNDNDIGIEESARPFTTVGSVTEVHQAEIRHKISTPSVDVSGKLQFRGNIDVNDPPQIDIKHSSLDYIG